MFESKIMVNYKIEADNNRIAAYDAGTVVGECTFSSGDEDWQIFHVFVEPQYRGSGVAQGLVDMVVSLARKAGVKIVPFCSYAKKLFATEQKYKDIVK